MAVLVHRDKLSLAWLDCGDKSSLGSRSGLVQHLEQHRAVAPVSL